MATNVMDGGAINRNADWCYANLDELLPKYDGKFVAISDEQVVGAFDTFGGGVHAMLEAGHQPRTFIVHHCLSPQAEKGRVLFPLEPRELLPCSFLIGMDIIAHGDLNLSNAGKTRFAW